MRTKHIFITLTSLAVILAGCADMDTFPEGDILTEDQKNTVVEDDPEKAEAGVTAIFSQFSTYMSITGSRHNDIGYPSVMLFTDANGFDCISDGNGYDWTGNSLDFADRNYAGNEAKIVWNTLYEMVYAANNVIISIDPDTEDDTFKFYLGQALAARAFDYWVLAQLYQFNYVDHKSSPCVPIITEKNMITAPVDGVKRSTVEEVYKRITDDLNTAIGLLTVAREAGHTRRDKRYIDLSVAYGLRARVNLTMENWSAAADDADKAILYSGAIPYSREAVSVPTMYDSNDAAWMWGIIVNETDRVVTSGIVNWPSHMGSLNYGYCNFSGSKQINNSLWKSIADSDVRKGWWINEDLQSPNITEAQQNFIIRNGYAPYTHVKFAPYNNVIGTSVNANDIPLMRVEEMYLIKAEALAMAGQPSEGLSTLVNFVTTYRDEDYTFASFSAEDIQEEVYRQRRIELWGEGLSWFDIMRLKKPVDRRGAGYPNATDVFNIAYGSDVLLWRLPEGEIQANPALSPEDNNPSALTPKPVTDEE